MKIGFLKLGKGYDNSELSPVAYALTRNRENTVRQALTVKYQENANRLIKKVKLVVPTDRKENIWDYQPAFAIFDGNVTEGKAGWENSDKEKCIASYVEEMVEKAIARAKSEI